MSYNLIITHVPPQRARSVLARHIARDPAISLQKALELLGTVPFVYSRELTREQAAREIANLKKLGIQLRVEEAGTQPLDPPQKKNPGSAPPAAPELHQSPPAPDTSADEAPTADLKTTDQPSPQSQSQFAESESEAESKSKSDLEPEQDPESDQDRDREPKSELYPEYAPKEQSPAVEPPSSGNRSAHSDEQHVAPSRKRGINHTPSLGETARDAKKDGGKKKAGSFFQPAIVLGIVGLIGFLLYHADQKKRFKISSDGPVLVKTGSKTSSRSADKRKKAALKRKPARRVAVDQLRKAQASMYVDSAAQAVELMKMINFYKIALSFNRYNLDAWSGLISAYKEAGMHTQAREAEEKMRELFGEDIHDIRGIVGRFGTLRDVTGPVNGIFRVTYKTSTISKAALEKETFLLARALGSSVDCETLILFASTAKGAGLLVRVPMRNFPRSFSDYVSRAQITSAQ